ncbi:uncharacterized protein LOC118392445 isoform X3 [Oncorhynchus keta]|uniref:uncharacterized protein LOC118392445 isoform X3 n=1 Tax=Oncorhynchus keta TaxID=8018 RepID=UPI00227A3A0B|nr:uncharacterized protein LOC118392445 isoform X3 [Oncorhynchus keta]
MKDTHTLLNLLLLLVYLAGSALTTDGGSGSINGPLELTIVGPDFVKVGVPRSFDCAAQCSPSCSYRMSIYGQIWQGNKLLFTARQWEESLNLTCTARNDDSGRSSTVSKILQVLAGPTNISITGPALMTPGAPKSFQCYADCRQSCNYTWGINGRWRGGQGIEITVTPEELATSVTLNCKAINSVSGLYDMATRTIPVTYDGKSMATQAEQTRPASVHIHTLTLHRNINIIQEKVVLYKEVICSPHAYLTNLKTCHHYYRQ